MPNRDNAAPANEALNAPAHRPSQLTGASSTGSPSTRTQMIRPYRVGRPKASRPQADSTTLLTSGDPVSGEQMQRVDRTQQRSIPPNATVKPVDRVDTAVRLISETAHDLRSPLASVSAAIEMLAGGEFGEVSTLQAECLSAAGRQCDYLNALVGEMLHADGVLNGMTTLHRRAVNRMQVQQMVTEATSAVLATKRIELLFDGINERSPSVYVDPAVLCRLLVNLVVNSERASAEDSHILIRVKDDMDAGVAQWSVVDCGQGMSPSQIAGLQNSEPVPGTQGTGLGLMICRQLATMQFSNLTIRSRLGSGTDVSFETPMAQVNAVAAAYARFRAGILAPRTAARQSQRESRGTADASPVSNWSEVSLGFSGAGPQRVSRVATCTLEINDDATNEQVKSLDRLLQSRLGRFELSYPTTRRDWILVLDADHRSIEDRMGQLSRIAETQIPQLQLVWGEPVVAPVSQRGLQCLLIDRMTKQALSAALVTGGGPIDQDSVRLGTEPIARTQIAASRLDAELRRLSNRLHRESTQLRNQAKGLRPPE